MSGGGSVGRRRLNDTRQEREKQKRRKRLDEVEVARACLELSRDLVD